MIATSGDSLNPADENEILFNSKNLPEIVHLLLKGLTARLT
jgi:hypothetical protein